MKGIIILEGADATGKTTLAKELVKQFNGHYMHLVYRWPKKMFTYQLAAAHRAIKLSQDKLVVIDRHWMSEWVYAKVFRGGTLWPEEGRMMDRLFRRFGATTIICATDDSDQYEKDFNEAKEIRPELFKNCVSVNEFYKRLYKGDKLIFDRSDYTSLLGYDGLFRDTKFFWYDRHKQGQDVRGYAAIVGFIVKTQLEYIKNNCLTLNPCIYNLLGDSSQCEYLFIGDKINKEKRVIDYPWMAHKNSSLFFAQCLTEIGVKEKGLCYVNLNDSYGPHILKEVMSNNECIPIFLGKNAEKAKDIVGAGICIYHPSYALRFDKKEEFKDQLIDALNLRRFKG